MLTQKPNVYAIPGWGFRASVFNTLNNEGFQITGLDYIHLSQHSLVKIAEYLSNSLPDQAILLGWSFGGLIAIKLAFLFPKKFKKLILLASQPRLQSTINWIGIDQKNAHDFKMALMNNFDKQLEYFIRLSCYPNSASATKIILKQHVFQERTQELTSLLSLLFDADLRTEYCRLDLDILHIISDKDAVIPQDPIQLNELNSRINTLTFQNVGHAGFVSNHMIYINAIKDYLDNV